MLFPMRKRPPRPRRRLPGIEVRWSGGAWRFRAAVKVEGVVVKGPTRDTQEAAYDDSRRMVEERGSNRWHVARLADALAQVVADAKARGLPRETIRRSILSHTRVLERYWPLETRLEDLDARAIERFVADQLKAGRSINTIRQKDLQILERAFRLAGELSPIREARIPRMRRPVMVYLSVQEVSRLVHQMRNGDFGVDLTARERHADLVELLFFTGMRVGELSRLRAGDVDLAHRRIRVESKDRSHPRVVEYPASIAGAVERLVRAAGSRTLITGMHEITNLCRKWKERLKEPRLNGRALRHGFATSLLANGAMPGEVKTLMGHKHLATTDRYVHEVNPRPGVLVQQLADVAAAALHDERDRSDPEPTPARAGAPGTRRRRRRARPGSDAASRE